jgi:hypothetical protein
MSEQRSVRGPLTSAPMARRGVILGESGTRPSHRAGANEEPPRLPSASITFFEGGSSFAGGRQEAVEGEGWVYYPYEDRIAEVAELI